LSTTRPRPGWLNAWLLLTGFELPGTVVAFLDILV
jgi:hypothetical protein